MFYVYRYIRLDTNTPFYVGKGKGNRAYQLVRSRNQYFKNIVNSTPYEIEIIMDNLTEDQAFTKEMEFIKLYKDLGYCETNLTDGGDGARGHTHSEQTIEKIRQKAIGRKYSTETCEKKRKSMLGKNKGDKNCMKNPETVEKMRQSKIGKVPWNKGLKGAQVAWNKGLSNEKTKLLAAKARQHRHIKTRSNYGYNWSK